MRKYIVGAIAGFFLATAISAHAEVVNMIGKAIDGAFPIKVNGEVLTDQAIVVEGTSYLPVRAFGNATGYDVKFDADMGITLTKKQDAAAQIPNLPSQDPLKANYKSISTVTINIGENKNTKTNPGDYGVFEFDGAQYVGLTTLSPPYDIAWRKPNAIFSSKGTEIKSIPISNDYTKGTAGFLSQGQAYVKLSELGLKARIDGDSIWIEKL